MAYPWTEVQRRFLRFNIMPGKTLSSSAPSLWLTHSETHRAVSRIGTSFTEGKILYFSLSTSLPSYDYSLRSSFVWGEVTTGVIKILQEYYEFGDGDVEMFLENEPMISDLLFEARGEIDRHFGVMTDVTLRVVSDPETEGDTRQLLAYVKTDLGVEEAMRRLDRFDEAWYLEALERAKGKLQFQLEFV